MPFKDTTVWDIVEALLFCVDINLEDSHEKPAALGGAGYVQVR